MKNARFWTENGNFWWKTCVSEQKTEIFDEKHAFLNKVRRFLMKNMRFWTKYSDFWWKTRVSEQNTAIFDEKHALLNRIRRFLMKNMRFRAEYSDFWWKTCVSGQKTEIFDEKHAFLNRIRRFLIKNARFSFGNGPYCTTKWLILKHKVQVVDYQYEVCRDARLVRPPMFLVDNERVNKLASRLFRAERTHEPCVPTCLLSANDF